MKYTKNIANITVFTALAVSLGYLLSFIPNLELITSTIFLCGILCGLKAGAITGLLSFSIFGFLNPYGPSPLPLLISQIIGGVTAGIMGGIFGKIKFQKAYIMVLFGIFVTFFYDMITTFSGYFFFPTGKTFLAYLGVGMPFVLWHIWTQSLVYGLVLPPVIEHLKNKGVY